MSVLMRWPDGRFKAVTLSYDDGMTHDIRLLDIMKKYNLKGTFNINSGCISKTDSIRGKVRLSERQMSELYSNSGNEVAVHGYSHSHLEELNPTAVCEEVLNDRKELERIFGGIVQGMAYPYGTYNDNVVEILKNCGIVYARTTVSTECFDVPMDWLRMPATCHHNNPRLFELVEKFIKLSKRPNNVCKLFYLWGHSFEFDADDNWEVIEKFGKLVGNRDNIWYATNIEIYDYVNAYKKLRFNASQTLVYNPTQTDLWICNNEKNIKIAAGEYLSLCC